MSEPAEFTIGSEVVCSDGVCGALRRVVVNPVARALTHLVVEPRFHVGTGHLVPINLVESAAHEIRLRCSTAVFHALEKAEEKHLLPGASGHWGYAQGDIMSLPYYTRGMGSVTPIGGLGIGARIATRHRVPDGEVEVRRGEHVHATDGAIGQIHGFVIDPTEHHVTHILLDEGHMWGKKTVAIPVDAVKDIDAGLWLTLSKREVGDLPPVALDD
jgi:hypothetical protein